jgi:hypothetical protein
MSRATEDTFERSPPCAPPVYVPIVRAPQAGRLVVISACPDMLGCWLHWTGEHLLPCAGRAKGCAGCKASHPFRWRGYIGCWLFEADKLAMLEVPALAANECLELAEGYMPDIRGYYIEAYRRREGANGRVCVEFGGQVDRNVAIPQPFDIRAALERIWTGGERREAPKGERS